MNGKDTPHKKSGRRCSPAPEVMERLRLAYEQKCGGSPTRLAENLNRVFPERCENGRSVADVKTIRNFFKEGFAAPALVDVFCRYLMGHSYDACQTLFTSGKTQVLAPPPYWVGRGEQIQRLLERLPRVLFLLGQGGIGKSTLARALANKLQDRFPCQVLITLGAERPPGPETLLLELLEQLGHPQANSVSDRGRAVLSYLSQKPCLVIIDNLDTLLEDLTFKGAYQGYQGLLEQLINLEHRSLVIVTSREKPMLFPRARDFVRYEEVPCLPAQDWQSFFEERYGESLSNLLHAPEQIQAIQQLGRQCEGHPLALDLLVGQILSHGRGDILNYLQVHRDQIWEIENIQDLIAEQFRRLQRENPVAWKLLVALGIYRGSLPLTLKAIAALHADERPVKYALDSLKNRFLIQVEYEGYRLHPLIAQYSRGELGRAGGLTDVHRRAANYWQNHLPATELQSWHTVAHWIEAFWHWCEMAEWQQAYSILMQPIAGKTLHKQLLNWAYVQELFELWERLQDHLADPQSQLKLHIGLAEIHKKLGNFEQVFEHATTARGLSESLNYSQDLANSIYLQGLAWNFQEQYLKARTYFYEAIQHFQEIGDREGEARCLNALGISYFGINDFATAQTYYGQSLNLFEKLKVAQGIAIARNNIAIIAGERCDYPTALYNYRKSLESHREAKDKENEGAVLTNLGVLYFNIGAFEQAARYLQEGLAIAQLIGNWVDELNGLTNLANLYFQTNDLTQAESYCQQVRTEYIASPQPWFLLQACFTLGQVYEAHQNWGEARYAYQESIDYARQNQEDGIVAEGKIRLAWVAFQQKQSAQADSLLGECLQYLSIEGPGRMSQAALFFLTCYDLLIARSRHTEARQILEKGAALIHEQAELIGDRDYRTSFTTCISANQELLARWQHQLGGGGGTWFSIGSTAEGKPIDRDIHRREGGAKG